MCTHTDTNHRDPFTSKTSVGGTRLVTKYMVQIWGKLEVRFIPHPSTFHSRSLDQHAHPAANPSIQVLYINNSTPGRTQPHYRGTLGSHVTCKKSPQQVTYVGIMYSLLHQQTLSIRTPAAPPDPLRMPLQLQLTPWILPLSTWPYQCDFCVLLTLSIELIHTSSENQYMSLEQQHVFLE